MKQDNLQEMYESDLMDLWLRLRKSSAPEDQVLYAAVVQEMNRRHPSSSLRVSATSRQKRRASLDNGSGLP